MENYILIGNENNDIYLKAYGHITANVSFPIREDLYKKISTFSVALNIFIDLSNIRYMDSTFMGLLVGIEKKLYSLFKIHLQIINPTDIAIKLLKNMNLINYLYISEKIIPDNIEFTPFDENLMISEIDKTKIMLCTHKDLISICEDNEKKFKQLEEILEKQLKEK